MTQPTIGQLYANTQATFVFLQVSDGQIHTFDDVLQQCYPDGLATEDQQFEAETTLGDVILDLEDWGFLRVEGDQERVQLTPAALALVGKVLVEPAGDGQRITYTLADGSQEMMLVFGF